MLNFFAIKKKGGRRSKQRKKSLSLSLFPSLHQSTDRTSACCLSRVSLRTRYACAFTRRDVDGKLCIGNSERRIYTSINVITRRRAAARRIRSCVSLIYIRFIHKERERGYIILCDIDADLGVRFPELSYRLSSFSFSLNRGIPMAKGCCHWALSSFAFSPFPLSLFLIEYKIHFSRSLEFPPATCHSHPRQTF